VLEAAAVLAAVILPVVVGVVASAVGVVQAGAAVPAVWVGILPVNVTEGQDLEWAGKVVENRLYWDLRQTSAGLVDPYFLYQAISHEEFEEPGLLPAERLREFGKLVQADYLVAVQLGPGAGAAAGIAAGTAVADAAGSEAATGAGAAAAEPVSGLADRPVQIRVRVIGSRDERETQFNRPLVELQSAIAETTRMVLMVVGEGQGALQAGFEAKPDVVSRINQPWTDSQPALELVGRGLLALDASDGAEAERLLVRALQLDPGFAAAQMALGQAYFALERYEEALRQFEAAAGNMAPKANIRFMQGLSLMQLGRSEEARSRLAEAVQLMPRSGPARATYALLLLEAGEDREAERQLGAAMQFNPYMAAELRPLLEVLRGGGRLAGWVMPLLGVLALLVSVVVHELAHGLAALWAGDPTAKEAGRLTWKPWVHLEVFGSILLPALLLATRAPVVFGWAKPVPINPVNFRKPRRDVRLVSLAGPFINLASGMAAVGLLLAVGWIVGRTELLGRGAQVFGLPFLGTETVVAGTASPAAVGLVLNFLKQLVMINFALAFFNLIPVPPLDGFHVVWSFLPPGVAARLAPLWNFGFLILFALIYLGITDYAIRPGLYLAQSVLIRGALLLGLA
jgi:Zn-dependent protease/Tfp pilus assembly protein PilF